MRGKLERRRNREITMVRIVGIERKKEKGGGGRERERE